MNGGCDFGRLRLLTVALFAVARPVDVALPESPKVVVFGEAMSRCWSTLIWSRTSGRPEDL
jgi:hypothetical protein